MRKVIQWGGILTLVGALLVGRASSTSAQDEHNHGQQAAKHHALHGDPIVLDGLVAATAFATNQRPRAIKTQVQTGASIAASAQKAGVSTEDVLAEFDQRLDERMAKSVERGKLPQSVATARAVWYKQSARLQIDQPGLAPPFPGLHEMHTITIGAATAASGLKRSDIRAQLRTCTTLTEIIASSDTTSAAVVAQAMTTLDQHFAPYVADGTLSTAQRDKWRPVLEQTVTNMLSTPGLHVAGKECAK